MSDFYWAVGVFALVVVLTHIAWFYMYSSVQAVRWAEKHEAYTGIARLVDRCSDLRRALNGVEGLLVAFDESSDDDTAEAVMQAISVAVTALDADSVAGLPKPLKSDYSSQYDRPAEADYKWDGELNRVREWRASQKGVTT